MSSSHGHSHAHGGSGDPTANLSPSARRRVVVSLTVVVVILFAATLVALVALWPRADPATYLPEAGRFAVPGSVELTGEVVSVSSFRCQSFDPDTGPTSAVPEDTSLCGLLSVSLLDGATAGQKVEVNVTSLVLSAGLRVGDSVRILQTPTEEGQPPVYNFVDTERGFPLALLTAIFAVLVVIVARVRGLLALVGLALSFLVIVKFLLPALLVGRNPLLVGVVAAAAIMFVVLYLAHGISIRTTTALVGTLSGLLAAALLGAWAVSAARLSGASSEESFTVSLFADRIDLSGLLLAGIVIASLGVLNDVTVTQASAVWELHALEPTVSARRLFAGVMRIGRDHIASSVYTIAFVYAGSALPVLLLITLYRRPLSATLASEALAEQVVSTLVGAIALVLSVPLTTAVGVALVTIGGHGSEQGSRRRRGSSRRRVEEPAGWEPGDLGQSRSARRRDEVPPPAQDPPFPS